MKTKEYIKDFITLPELKLDHPSRDKMTKHILDLTNHFMSEFEKTSESRNIGKGSEESSLINLLNDYKKKWTNIAFGINQKLGYKLIKMNGFIDLFLLLNPDCKYMLERYEKDKG